MSGDCHCILPASLPCLPLATAFVEDFCRDDDIARNDVLRLMLIAEELFTNTVAHGRRADGDIRLRLGLNAGPQHVELVYEDSAAAFDPLSRAEEATADPEPEIAEGRRGGLGLTLVTQVADAVRYACSGRCNRLSIVLLRET